MTGKPFIFAVGADLKGLAVIRDHAHARIIGQLGHVVFRRLGELDIPSFAFVNGAAMGGGVEIALHCTYRTISSGVPAVALPECFLGLVPGWGGTYLLPRLIGPAPALKIIVENALNQNRMLKGPQAFKLGIADAMFEPADFLEQSMHWVADVLHGETRVERPEIDRDERRRDLPRHDLDRPPVHAGEGRPQRLVPLHDFLESSPQRLSVQGPLEPQRQRHVILRAPTLQLINEPQPLLRI